MSRYIYAQILLVKSRSIARVTALYGKRRSVILRVRIVSQIPLLVSRHVTG